MFITGKIAIRNVFANRKRSFLIGFVIFITAFLLLAANAMVNGVGKQVSKSYDNIQAADVVVVWNSLDKVAKSDATRFLFLQPNGFDPKRDDDNQQAINELDDFVKTHQDEILGFYPLVRRNAQLVVEDDVDAQFSIYGMTPELGDYMEKQKAISMKQGVLIPKDDDGITISQEKANDNDLHIGDKIKVNVVTPDGKLNTKELVVEGIYANGAAWDNWNGFMLNHAAQRLFEYTDSEFDLGKIYLKDSSQSAVFAKRLNGALGSSQSVLHAEANAEASTMYPIMSTTLKGMFNVFIFFLLVVIAIGLRSTIRMNLYERMREFGTLRAVGYSRSQSYSIIFFEAFFLSLFALAVAFGLAVILQLILGKQGIYLGPGPLSYFGGEYLYPSMQVSDVVLAIIVMVIFTLISTLSPGLQLCFQNITDIMAKRQKRVSVIKMMFRREENLG